MRIQEREMNRFVYGLGIFVLVILTWIGVSRAAEEPIQLKLARPIIKISTFYNGTTLKATGTIPADADVLVQVIGLRKDVHLKVKGKVAGLLWMNKTDVELKNTPAVYMIYTPDKVEPDLLLPELGVGSETLVKDIKLLHVGYKNLVKDITINPSSANKVFIFSEYVKLMEKDGVYAVNNGDVIYGEVKNGQKKFSVTLSIPPKMSAGEYEVKALAIRDAKTIGQVRESLRVELSGLPKFIASLSYDHSLLFGIMAVVIAIATGLIIGVLFKGGGGAH